MNSLYQQLMGSQAAPLLNNMKQAKQMLNMLKSMGNPQALLENALKQNPQLADIVKSSNGDYKKAFYTYAEKLGINPEEIAEILKG